jgi:hypothetical protein
MARKTKNQIFGEYTSPRVYFDNGCHEFKNKYTWEVKLQKIAEFIYEGQDLMRYLKSYINYYYKSEGYEHMLGSLEQTLNMYIWQIQTGETWKHLKINHYASELFDLIRLFESELRTNMKTHPEKYPFIKEKKKKTKSLRWYKKYELEELLNAYIQTDSNQYNEISSRLGLDITIENKEYFDSKNKVYFSENATQLNDDSNFTIKFDYRNLQRLLHDYLRYLKTKEHFPKIEMGCALNQIYFFIKGREIKEKEFLEYGSTDFLNPFVVDLLMVCYGKKIQPSIGFGEDSFKLENWKLS